MLDSVNYKNENINHTLFRYTFARELSMEGHCRKHIEITKLEFQMSANSSDKNTIIQRNNSKVADKTDRTPLYLVNIWLMKSRLE